MKKLREWFLIDEWVGLFIRNMRAKHIQREIRRCLKYKIKYETSRQIARELREDFCKHYPDSPLNE